jgi:hypothetical protein
MAKSVDVVKNLPAKGKRNERAKSGSGNISQEGNSGGKWNGNDGQRRQGFENGNGGTVLLGLCHIKVGERQRKKGRRRRRGNKIDGRNGRTRTGKDISNNILRTREVDKISGELRKKGKVPLLTGRERSFGFGNGRNQRFVVSEKGERTTFEKKAEMADRKESSKELSVKGGITGLSRGKFVGKESHRLPGRRGTLLQNSTNVGI